MRPPESLETPRLLLRRPTPEDADVIFETYAQDPEVTRHLHWRPHRSLDDTREFLRRCEESWQSGSAFPWVITRREDHQLIGGIEVRIDGHRADLGYVLAPSHWGQGYATEATRAVVEWALAQPALFRVWAFCDIANPASARVLEKAGMRREGILRRWGPPTGASPEPVDCFCYAAVK